MSNEITDDLLTLQKHFKVGDLSSKHLAEEMRKKYESKIDEFSSSDVQLLYTCEYGKCRLATLSWLNNTIFKPKLIINQLLKLYC